VSTQQVAIVDVAVRTKLILDSVDSWLLAQRSLVNVRARSLIPVVIQRGRVARSLAHFLQMLGLERRTRTHDLARVLAEPSRESDVRLDDDHAVTEKEDDQA
jgi:hypothetical protein